MTATPHASNRNRYGSCPLCGRKGPVLTGCTSAQCQSPRRYFISDDFAEDWPDAEQVEVGKVGTRIGQYIICKDIHRSGLKEIYTVASEATGALFALTLLHQRGRNDHDKDRQFNAWKDAYQELRKLRHRNILKVHEFDQFAGTPYVVSEYVGSGTTLRDLLVERRTGQRVISHEDAVRLVIQIGAGLDVLHDAELSHLDLTPDNVMIRKTGHPIGEPVLIDFRVTQDFGPNQPTRPIGKPTYMAPEQWSGGGFGPHTDIYTLGVLAYELIVGRPPFDEGGGHNVYDLKHDSSYDPMAKLPAASFPDGFIAFGRRALAGKPAKRYASAGALAAAMENVFLDVDGKATYAPREMDPEKLWKMLEAERRRSEQLSDRVNGLHKEASKATEAWGNERRTLQDRISKLEAALQAARDADRTAAIEREMAQLKQSLDAAQQEAGDHRSAEEAARKRMAELQKELESLTDRTASDKEIIVANEKELEDKLAELRQTKLALHQIMERHEPCELEIEELGQGLVRAQHAASVFASRLKMWRMASVIFGILLLGASIVAFGN